jgi:UDP-N-acetyl-D-glucosamine dehydrogenase
MTDWIEHFRSADVKVGVMGLGYVGLPLCVEMAKSGLDVLGFDVDTDVVETVNRGESHIQDVGDEELCAQVNAGRLSATADMSRLDECDAISICVPTPLGKFRDPDISFVLEAGKSIAATLRTGQLVILESTTYPGTTRDVLVPLFEREGFTLGEDLFVCFSPERVDPGNETWHTKNTPKVIGGVTPRCVQAGSGLYGRIFDTLVPVSSTEAAEMVKILENTFRAVNIGLVNETAQIADRLGVNIWEVIDAAATKPFGFMRFTPGPGLGGHCIPVDPHYLSWKMRTLDYKTRFIELASEVNGEMPRFVSDKVREALNGHRKSVNGSRILVVGVAYKPDIDDVRETPALNVMTYLEADGAIVEYHDPYVPDFEDEDGRHWTSVELTDETLGGADAVVIVTDHKTIDFERVLDRAEVVIDARNVMGKLMDNDGRTAPAWIVKGAVEAS